jgi:predicted DNA-binding transcriptional regulator AlpA
LGFPKPVQLADGTVGYFEHEVDEWLAGRPRCGAGEAE